MLLDEYTGDSVYSRHFVASRINAPAVVVAVVFTLDHIVTTQTTMGWTKSLQYPHVQPLSRSSLVFPLVLNPQLHAPYISSPSHRYLFTTHDRTSGACSAAIPMICHLPLVSLSAPYLGVYLLA